MQNTNKNYIKNMTKATISDNTIIEIKLTQIAKSLKGNFTAPKNFDYKKELKNILSDKYFKIK